MQVAIWILPLALLLSQSSPWAVVAAILAGWHIASLSSLPQLRPDPLRLDLFQTFSQLNSLPLVPSPLALGSAACLQAGTASLYFAWTGASALLLGITSASLAGSIARYRMPKAKRTPESPRRPMVSAALLTVIGLLHFVSLGGGGETSGKSGSPNEAAQSSARQSSNDAVSVDGTYKGVFLQPESVPHVVLVPPLPSLSKDLFTNRNANPLSVPFFGSYWMFRWPLRRPPADSYVLKGDPLSLAFHSSDASALQMEAHQNFGRLIALRCCSKIQLVLRSTGPVAVALLLTNTTLPEKPTVRLGTFTVDSKSAPAPLQIVVPFDVPLGARITEFDEATIVFRKGFARASPKVAIDRFVFIPRGQI